MISVEAVRAAMLSDMPWTRLDEIVRAEMAAGRKVKEIADDLVRMSDEVWNTPGLSEDGEDAFGDTLDALTGNCRSDCCYYDPPNTSLPTEEEIAQLPRWARVAFAARCARRVLPLYGHYWEGKFDYHRQDVWNAIESAETSAAKAQEYITGKAWANEAALDSTNEYASFAADAAAAAGASIYGSVVTGRSAVLAATAITNLSPVIRRDFDHLARLAEWQHWTDDTPVPPEVFGPLWPEGPPAGWPADPDLPRRTDLPLELLSAARARDFERITEDDAVRLFDAINAYYIARTGDRLTMDDLRPLIAAGVPVEV